MTMVMTLGILLLTIMNSAAIECPANCECKDRRVTCGRAGLTAVPRVPLDTTFLDLYDNQISEIKVGDFDGLVDLTALYMGKNLLTKLKADSFRGISNLVHLQLYRNSIRDLENGTFNGLRNLKVLTIYRNDLKTLQREVFGDLQDLNSMDIHRNPIVCDCSIRWFVNSKLRQVTTGNCMNPQSLSHRELSSLTEEDLQCGPVQTTDNMPTTITKSSLLSTEVSSTHKPLPTTHRTTQTQNPSLPTTHWTSHKPLTTTHRTSHSTPDVTLYLTVVFGVTTFTCIVGALLLYAWKRFKKNKVRDRQDSYQSRLHPEESENDYNFIQNGGESHYEVIRVPEEFDPDETVTKVSYDIYRRHSYLDILPEPDHTQKDETDPKVITDTNRGNEYLDIVPDHYPIV